MNRLALIAVVASLAACSTVQSKSKALACQNTPQWYTNDTQGKPVAAVSVCFGDDGHLLWNSRGLSLDELQKLTTPAAPAAVPQAKK